MNTKKITSWLIKPLGVVAATALLATQAFAGWSVNGTKVVDPNGNNFVFRGINHAHTWYTDKTEKAMADIAATGANSIRVVLGNGSRWTRTPGSEVANLITLCKNNKLVCVLEVHDSTGFGDDGGATNISNAANYWASADIKNAIIGQEDYVIVNIANEPYGNNVSSSTFVNEVSAAIKTIRNAGLTHLIMVDGPNWGQDYNGIMRDNASTIFNADMQGNTMFSVHMYEVYNNPTTIRNYLTGFQSKGRALVIGEFGTENNGKDVDEVSILQIAQSMGIGYIGWSWSGNGSCCLSLDIVNSWNPGSLTTWGNTLINNSNGIKATSKLATNYVRTTSSSASSVKSSSATVSSSVASSSQAAGENCNWYGNIYPICVNQPEGWGWENEKSCIGRTNCAALPSPYGIIGAASSRATSSTPVSSSSVATSTAVSSSVASSTQTQSSSSAATSGLSCSYVVTNSWGNGFTASIRVTNKGTTTKNGWTATWSYSGNNRRTSGWNANVSGNNPYTATNVDWNGRLDPGQTTEFGLQGSYSGTIEIPNVKCN